MPNTQRIRNCITSARSLSWQILAIIAFADKNSALRKWAKASALSQLNNSEWLPTGFYSKHAMLFRSSRKQRWNIQEIRHNSFDTKGVILSSYLVLNV